MCLCNIDHGAASARVAQQVDLAEIELLDERCYIGGMLLVGEIVSLPVPFLRIIVPKAYRDDAIILRKFRRPRGTNAL
jgi:hypothetical protein